MPLCGGTAGVREATADVQKACDEVKARVEQILQKSFREFRALHYRPQTVAGVNYFVKVATGDGAFVHLRIYKNLQGKVSLSGVQPDKTELEEIAYFEKHLDDNE